MAYFEIFPSYHSILFKNNMKFMKISKYHTEMWTASVYFFFIFALKKVIMFRLFSTLLRVPVTGYKHYTSSIIDTTNKIIINDVINLTRRCLHGISRRQSFTAESYRDRLLCCNNTILGTLRMHSFLLEKHEWNEWGNTPSPP